MACGVTGRFLEYNFEYKWRNCLQINNSRFSGVRSGISVLACGVTALKWRNCKVFLTVEQVW